MKYITDTGYPVMRTNIDPAYREVYSEIEACGSNLDAPRFLISGALFYASLSKQVVPEAFKCR